MNLTRLSDEQYAANENEPGYERWFQFQYEAWMKDHNNGYEEYLDEPR